MWFRHMAKGRARKQIYKAVDDARAGMTDWFKIYREAEEEMLASAVHPTHIAGFMSVAPHISDPTVEGWGNERHVSSGSRRTLLFCSIRCIETLIFDARVYGVIARIRRRLPDHLGDVDLSPLSKSTGCAEQISIELLRYMAEEPLDNSSEEENTWEDQK